MGGRAQGRPVRKGVRPQGPLLRPQCRTASTHTPAFASTPARPTTPAPKRKESKRASRTKSTAIRAAIGIRIEIDRLEPAIYATEHDRLSPDYSRSSLASAAANRASAGYALRSGDVLDYLAGGMTIEEILDDLPDLTKDDILACFAFAAERAAYDYRPAASAVKLLFDQHAVVTSSSPGWRTSIRQVSTFAIGD